MLPKWGLEGVGVAFCVTSVAYALFVSWFVDRRSSDGLLRHALVHIIVMLSLLAAAKFIAVEAPGHLQKAAFYAVVAAVSAWGYRLAIRKTS
jgi:O-antigen/teichoic acid export membrane protein